MEQTKLDPNQISQSEHDQVAKAKKVKIVDTAFSIELDAEDGDSVISKKQTKAVLISDGVILDLSMVGKVCLFGANSAKLEIMLDSVQLDAYTIQKGIVQDVCLTQVKVTLSDPETTSYLMVQ